MINVILVTLAICSQNKSDACSSAGQALYASHPEIRSMGERLQQRAESYTSKEFVAYAGGAIGLAAQKRYVAKITKNSTVELKFNDGAYLTWTYGF